MRAIGLTAAVLVMSTLGACRNDGRPQFISDTGVSSEVRRAAIEEDGLRKGDLISDGLVYQFKLAAQDARPFSTGATPSLIKNDPAKQRVFMDAGFALIQARCNRYILAKADNQRRVNVWRDTFAPVTALLTGAVALIGSGEDTSNDALTALSLGTSAASAGFRIYEQRYLFGAENVNSVRLLILKALADNASAASDTSDANLTYSQSVTHLINNQAVCSPGHILQLVSAAIEAGKVVSIKSDTGAAPATTPADKARAELAEVKSILLQLKQNNLITDAQIAAAKAKVALPPALVPAQPAGTPPRSLEIVTTKVVNN